MGHLKQVKRGYWGHLRHAMMLSSLMLKAGMAGVVHSLYTTVIHEAACLMTVARMHHEIQKDKTRVQNNKEEELMARIAKLPKNVEALIRAIKTDEKAFMSSDKRGWTGVKDTDLPDGILRRAYDKIAKIEKLYKTKQITKPQYKLAMNELSESIPRIQERIAKSGFEFSDVPKELQWNPDTMEGPQKQYYDPAKAKPRPVRNIPLEGARMPQVKPSGPGPKLPGMLGTAGSAPPINLKPDELTFEKGKKGAPNKTIRKRFGLVSDSPIAEGYPTEHAKGSGRVSPIGREGSYMQTMLGKPTREQPTGKLRHHGVNAEPAGATVRGQNRVAAAAKEAGPVPGMGPWKPTGRTEIPDRLATPARIEPRPNALGSNGIPERPVAVDGTHRMRLRQAMQEFDLGKAGKLAGKAGKGAALGMLLSCCLIT